MSTDEDAHAPTHAAPALTTRSDTVASGDPSPAVSGPLSLARYSVGGTIGRGGMGEIIVARDLEIGRDVAVKRLSTRATPAARERFLREARIQARLEHPAIVPVYELGRDADDEPFFAMKRVSGVTLAETLATDPPRQRLLRLFAEICRAVAFAHSRGIVHRDLKPTNIMLGDFGEVYVLDWGVARVTGTDDERASHSDIGSFSGDTQAGALLGTPGYMAPEQIEDAHGVDARADVYSLGAILFEILTGERLYGTETSLLVATLAGVQTGPRALRPDRAIPPELDELCLAALALDPADRPTARSLAERVEGYVDGDRDLEQRRRVAELEIAAARTSLASGSAAGRVEAMQHATRALALDQEARAASEIISELVLFVPAEASPELQEQFAKNETIGQRRQGRVAAASLSTVFLFLALSAWNGIRDWSMFVSTGSYVLVLLLTAVLGISRRRLSSREMIFVTLANSVLPALISRAFGLLVLAPVLSCITVLSLSSYPQNMERRSLLIVTAIAGWLAPVVLELVGVLTPTWTVTAGAIISTSPMIRIGGHATIALIVAAHIIAISVFSVFASALARSRRDALRQVESQAWHLRQLLPAPH
ncbi:MAG TPA: serine/threonine-protein kinase [Kofleriaceae bacterium]|jgi:serine/threonine-protein kinase